MTLAEAEALFHREVARLAPEYPFLTQWTYGLIRRGSYRALGLCSYRRKQITINPEFIEKGRPADVLDTILHELGHAIAGSVYGRKGQNHGHLWKAVCRKIGADPSRIKAKLGFEFDAKKAAKWIVRNKETGEVYIRFVRRPAPKDWTQRWIGGKKAQTFGKLELVPAGTPLASRAETHRAAACTVAPIRNTTRTPPEKCGFERDQHRPGEQLNLF